MGPRFKQASTAAAQDTQQGFLGTTLPPQKAPYTGVLEESKLVLTQKQELKIVHSFLAEDGGSAEVWDGIASDENLLYATKNLRRLGVDTDGVADNPESLVGILKDLTARKPLCRFRVVESTGVKTDGTHFVNVYIDRVLQNSTTGVETSVAPTVANDAVVEGPDEAPEPAVPAPAPIRRGRPPKNPPPVVVAPAPDPNEDETPEDPDAPMVSSDPNEISVEVKVGDKVEFPKADGSLVQGTIAKDNGDDTFNVRASAKFGGKLLGPIHTDKIILLENAPF